MFPNKEDIEALNKELNLGVRAIKNGYLELGKALKKAGFNSMKLEIPIGTRAKTNEIRKTFNESFLRKKGVKVYRYNINPRFSEMLTTVKTKYGEMVAHDDDVLTYVGDGIWDVRRDVPDED